MFEMFSAQPQNAATGSYWMINTSQTAGVGAAVYEIGVPINEKIDHTARLGVRVVAFTKKDTTISSGNGTEENPYVIK